MDLTRRYADQIRALLPMGAVWQFDTARHALVMCLAAPLAKIHARAVNLQNEADPRTTVEALSDWENMLGLPDACMLRAGTPTFAERRAAVVAKLTARGGLSAAYYYAIATTLGYSVKIETFRPFICGLGRCGQRLAGEDARFVWRVRVMGPRVSRFHAKASRAGERLGKISRAADLECRLYSLAPSHTDLIFSYEV